MSQWFRWHAGTVEDAKFRVTARNAGVTVRDVIALWAFLLEDAASDKHRGISTRGGDFVAAVLDMEVEVVEVILEAMTKLEMIYLTPDGITINNWGKRQYETDTYDNTNAERQRRWRNSHKPESKRDSNGSVTAVKPPETEAETDTDKKEIAAIAAPKPKRALKSFLAEDWKPEGNLSDRQTAELAKMRDWAKSNAARKADWPATWRNWLRRAGVPEAQAPPARDLVHVQDDTPEMDAWDRHWRQTKGVNAPRSKHGGIFVDSQWPPGVDNAWDSNADQSPRA